MENDTNAFLLLKKHGFWMKRIDWLAEHHHRQFYEERKYFLMMLTKLMTDLSNFEKTSFN